MPSRSILIVALAVVLGLVAVWLGNSYFTGVQQREVEIAEQNKLARIVVASQDLAFGAPLSSQNVRLINWPQGSVPVGAFTTVEEATRNRVALRPMVIGEPVLASRVSGTNARASISANLPAGQVAYTIQVSDVSGVGGFARPGDVVDILLTRNMPGQNVTAGDKMTDVVLHAIPLLGIDLVADENKSGPVYGKTATLQVSITDAQKLALASQVGILSLALRNVADKTPPVLATVLPRDLSAGRVLARAPGAPMLASTAGTSAPARPRIVRRAAPAPRPKAPAAPPSSTMTIIRGTNPTDYEVRHGR
ncbi:Flp pilus assembly protein CpaB [Novosphingobium flavum]|uniref:Flp pilus assembly protein CpaB n=1 Tax=Novosphingobium flavum TaxID=1778672 RepID=A0A7X1FSS4_9SPHN|nr:Flp pilus assembly protein CpaB [Novosphingobium flavum]MBC2666295.1 Flp pilus assembly protein CpaB [Novosphingobium flavum]